MIAGNMSDVSVSHVPVRQYKLIQLMHGSVIHAKFTSIATTLTVDEMTVCRTSLDLQMPTGLNLAKLSLA